MNITDDQTTYVCVDLEASGPVPGLYNLVSIGGVEVKLRGDRHIRGREFYFELKHKCIKVGKISKYWYGNR